MNTRRSNRCTSCSFLSSAPCRGGMIVLRSFERSASGAMSSASRSFSQSSSSEVEGFFFKPGTSRTSKNTSSASKKRFFEPRKVHVHDLLHRFLVGEADVMKETTPEKGVGQLFFVVRGDEDDRT